MYLVKRKNAFTGRFLICGLWNAVIFPIKLLVFSSSVSFSSKITNWVSGICWAIRCFCLRWSRPVVSRSTLWRRVVETPTFPCLWPRPPKPQLDWLVDLAFHHVEMSSCFALEISENFRLMWCDSLVLKFTYRYWSCHHFHKLCHKMLGYIYIYGSVHEMKLIHFTPPCS